MPWAIAAAVAAVAGAAIGGVSAANAADAQQKSAEFNAEVQANNAKIAAQQRSAALQQGQQQAQQAEMQQAQLHAQQVAAISANGVDLNSGSATDLLATTKFLGNQDVATIQNNAARQAWGYSIDSQNSSNQSLLNSWQASRSDPTTAGVMSGVGSLLSSASSYAGSRAAAKFSAGSQS